MINARTHHHQAIKNDRSKIRRMGAEVIEDDGDFNPAQGGCASAEASDKKRLKGDRQKGSVAVKNEDRGDSPVITMTANHAAQSAVSKKEDGQEQEAKVEIESKIAAAVTDFALLDQMQAAYYRQAYRMTPGHFWRLYNILCPHLNNDDTNNGKLNVESNIVLKLSTSIRYFAGGDTARDHGIPQMETIEGYIWEVVDAIHACNELNFEFPISRREQQEIAAGFEMIKSDIGIDSCVGSVGSMLLWIEKPDDDDDDHDDDGSMLNYFHNSVKKYCIKLQAVCDYDGRFIDAAVGFPGNTSDFEAFKHSELHQKLGTAGFLADNLALFGRMSYAPSPFVVTPFPADKELSSAQKEFNRYHNQLSDNIDLTFFNLLQRWPLLRQVLPRRFGISKQRALVLALLKLYNYCLNDTEPMLPVLVKDLLYSTYQVTASFPFQQDEHLSTDTAELFDLPGSGYSPTTISVTSCCSRSDHHPVNNDDDDQQKGLLLSRAHRIREKLLNELVNGSAHHGSDWI